MFPVCPWTASSGVAAAPPKSGTAQAPQVRMPCALQDVVSPGDSRLRGSDARHLAMNVPGVIVPDGPVRPVRDAVCLFPQIGARAVAPVPSSCATSRKMPRHSAGRNPWSRDQRSPAMPLEAASGYASPRHQTLRQPVTPTDPARRHRLLLANPSRRAADPGRFQRGNS